MAKYTTNTNCSLRQLKNIKDINFFNLVNWLENKQELKSIPNLSKDKIINLICEFCQKNDYRYNNKVFYKGENRYVFYRTRKSGDFELNEEILDLSDKLILFCANLDEKPNEEYLLYKQDLIELQEKKEKERSLLEEKRKKESAIREKESAIEKRKNRKILKNNFIRYSNIPFHGLFLASKNNSKALTSFFWDSLDDIDEITRNRIDIYFSSSEILESGYTLLNQIDLLRDKKILLPALVVWNKDNVDALIEFPLTDFDEGKFLQILQLISYEINRNDHIERLFMKVLKAFENSHYTIPRLIKNREDSKKEGKPLPKKFKTRLKNLIKANLTEKAIELFETELELYASYADYDKERLEDSLNKLIVLLAELKREYKNWITGIITLESLNVTRNRINLKLLELIENF